MTTRRTEYGMRAVLHLARKDPGRVTAATISADMGIPQGFLHQVLQALQRGGLVGSVSGRHGGYSLSRPPAEISLLEIVEALEGPLDVAGCALRDGPCHWDDACAVHDVWSTGRKAFSQSLAESSLADVSRADQQREAGDYEIAAGTHCLRGRPGLSLS
ncbi:MAG: Rrf2 family transcriptional regulator [Actinomycetia bacterium]|nr:Rrf2 family transcriptional regulator [Actinomycetes bacterium]